MKNHLKRVTSPKTWSLSRRERVFVTRPKPSGHPLSQGMPLGVVMRDTLNLASTMSEVKKILNNKDVLVDGKRRKDHRFLVGLFDTISFPTLHKYYRVTLNENSHLTLIPIKAEEAALKPCKIVGKSVVPGGKVQFHLHDGRNVFAAETKEKSTVGDTVVLTLPDQKIHKVLPLKAGMMIFLHAGKNAGQKGYLHSVTGHEAIYTSDSQEIGTVKKYLFVIGEKEPVVTISEKHSSK